MMSGAERRRPGALLEEARLTEKEGKPQELEWKLKRLREEIFK